MKFCSRSQIINGQVDVLAGAELHHSQSILSDISDLIYPNLLMVSQVLFSDSDKEKSSFRLVDIFVIRSMDGTSVAVRTY